MVKKKLKLKKPKINEKEKRITIKLFLSIIYLIVISILLVCSYKVFKEKNKIISWSNVQNSNQYTFIKISRMSEKFAYDSVTNKGYHFVIEKEKTGLWHTYLICINENDYNKYKELIDYTYERIETEPKELKVYGYPVLIDNNLKELSLKNITKFLPAENEIEITTNNFENYLTNSYLDTTIPKNEDFNYILFTLMMILVIVIILFVITVFYKEKNSTIMKEDKKKQTNKKNQNKQNEDKKNKELNKKQNNSKLKKDEELEII